MRNINYATEIKAFYVIVQNKQLSTGQIALWHALMHVNNESYWKEQFEVANKRLELLTGLSRQGIEKNRNVLKQFGLMDFKSNGTKAATYMLKSLQESCQDSLQGSLQNGCQDGLQSSCQDSLQNSSTLINNTKQDKTKKKDTNVSKENLEPVSSETKKEVDDLVQQFEELYAIYPKKQGKEEALRCFMDDVRMGVAIEEIKQGVQNYVNHCKEQGTKDQFICMISNFFSKRRWRDDWVRSNSQTQKNEEERIPDGNEIVDKIFKECLEKGLPLPEIEGPF